MNAYPAELVVHLHPFALVTGVVRDREGAPRSAPAHALPAPTERFSELSRALADTLRRRGAPRVWAPPGGAPHFRFALAGYAHTYPPAKVRGGARIASEVGRRAVASLPPRSPLSPLFVGGPLFPDGILAPAWVRKHTEYVPSVHVAVFVLSPPTLEEDAALIAALNDVRTRDTARGIRTAAVLVGAPDVLERSDADARLAHLRRAASLDARGALFVLPASGADVEAFVQHLERTLYEGACEYYRERARHVRRNRARYPPPPSITQPVLAAAAAAGALRPNVPAAVLAPEGWTVRTTAKLGAFAEFQGDLAEAAAQYTDAYEQLVHACLGNTRLLAPRTKRWAEAKVLVDTLSLKLVKLHLYRGALAPALAQFERHTRRVAELSTGWGIGTATPEFWSWLAKQFQLLGDLVQHATHPPDGTRPLGAPPAAAAVRIARAGPHLYHAALCTLERARRFRALADPQNVPNYASETQVDHAALAAELLGAAYEAFKHAHHVRHAHLAAARIALVYAEAERAKDALPYLERTLRWYRRAAWAVPRAVLAAHAALCAHAAGDDRAAVLYALEAVPRAPEAVRPLQDEVRQALHTLLAPAEPAGAQDAARGAAPALLLEPGTAPLASVSAVFARGRVADDAAVAFQIAVRCKASSAAPRMLRVYLEDATEPLVTARLGGRARHADVGVVTPPATAEPRDALDAACVLTGALRAPPGRYALTRAILTVDTGVAPVDVPLDIAPGTAWATARGRLALPPAEDTRAVHVAAPTPTLALDAPATLLTGEVRALTVEVGAPLVRGMLVLPPETLDAGAVLRRDGEESDVPGAAHRLPVPAGKSTVWLHAPQASGTLPVRLYGVADAAPDALPAVHTDRVIAVASAFGVRVHTQWLPGPVPRRGRLTAEAHYLGDTPLTLDAAHVEVAPGDAVAAGALLGADAGAWHAGDRAVWTAALTEAAGTPGTGAALCVAWRRAGGAASTTRLRLAPLAPPPPPAVQVQLRAPGRMRLDVCATLHVAVSNASTAPLDVLVEVEQGDAFFLAGARRRLLAVLLPGEVRTLPVALLARVTGLHTLPRVRAYEVVPGAEPVALGVPLPGVVVVE
ncbi:hypothetical protein MOBT1_000462 [Malassezia obtusa]|uniref:Trafficking protein particle complex subunit 11 domain-containing protein n=1 Tax=Malassezia obtusa TaxID=76774 RepID=A0AAF0DX29_9BASI|nr:hypothetical protein MOBT1_000462 [Malassezia obtusa]